MKGIEAIEKKKRMIDRYFHMIFILRAKNHVCSCREIVKHELKQHRISFPSFNALPISNFNCGLGISFFFQLPPKRGMNGMYAI